MRDIILLVILLSALMFLVGCFPVWYDTSGISHYLHEYEKARGVSDDENWVDTKKDGTPQTIGLHFKANGHQPIRLLNLDLFIIRTALYWPLFHSTSVGLIGYRGLQFYHSFLFLGAKYDPTEDDFMCCSNSLRIHKLSPAGLDNQAGS